MKPVTYPASVLFVLLFSVFSPNLSATEACGLCPSAYCEDISLAQSLKSNKKRNAEKLGLPHRLSTLFDRLGNCRACIENAPDWPHLIVSYDGERLSELYQDDIESYTSSYPWSASAEYKARQDKIAGLATEFHITLGSKPCTCCKATNEDEYKSWVDSDSLDALQQDPMWNSKLETYQTQTISYTSEQQARDIPPDLEQIAPINMVSEPLPGRLGDFTQGVPIEPVQILCQACAPLTAQYNEVAHQINRLNTHLASQLRDVKYEEQMAEYSRNSIDNLHGVANTENVRGKIREHKARMEQAYSSLETLRPALFETQGKVSKNMLQLAGIAAELNDCGAKQCLQDQKVSDLNSLFQNYQGVWNGPYASNCKPCTTIIERLNAIPELLTSAHFKLLRAQYSFNALNTAKETSTDAGETSSIVTSEKKAAAARKEVDDLIRLGNQMLSELMLCEQKYCSTGESSKSSRPSELFPGSRLRLDSYSICPQPPASDSLIIGPNDEFGSGADFKEKAGKKVAGAAAGAIAGLLGFKSGGGGGSDGPPTYKDPIKKKHKLKTKDKKEKREFYTGGVFTKDGLLISNSIKKTPGKGTFHSIYLENPQGWRLMPVSLYMFEIWGEWNLSVSWTQDTYVNGEHVSHEEGGWDESWKELIAKGEYTNYVEIEQTPIWEQLGFNTAVSGARALGTVFPITQKMLAEGPWNLVVHISEPKKDPVTSKPYIFELTTDDKGAVTVAEVDKTTASTNDACKFITTIPGGQIEAPGVSTEDGKYYFTPAEVDSSQQSGIKFSSNGKTFETTPLENTASKPAGIDSQQQTETPNESSVPANIGRILNPEEIALLKSAKGPNDRDGDGIDDSIDTYPDQPSDSFLVEGGTTGRVINPNGNSVSVTKSADGEVNITVGNESNGKPAEVEILGIGLDLDPGTIIEAGFG